MRRLKLLALAVAGVVLPVALVFSAYMIAQGSIGVAGTVPPVPQNRVEETPSPASTDDGRNSGVGSSDSDDRDDRESDGSDGSDSDNSGSGSDSSGPGSGDDDAHDDSSNSGPGGGGSDDSGKSGGDD